MKIKMTSLVFVETEDITAAFEELKSDSELLEEPDEFVQYLEHTCTYVSGYHYHSIRQQMTSIQNKMVSIPSCG